MAFRINPVVKENDFQRHNTTERQYLADLDEKGLLLKIDNIAVDAEQLVLRTFQCNTEYCVRCKGKGANMEYVGSCCTDLSVDVSKAEVEGFVELAKMARKNLDLPKKEPVRVNIERILTGKITEENEDGELELKHKRNGSCIMSWIDDAGQLRCSINTLVDRLNLKIEDYKAVPCYLFPLHYAEFGDDYILTVLSEETRFWIEQHRDVAKLRCLRLPEPDSPPAYEFLRYEIEYLLGKRFYRELDKRAKPILAKLDRGDIELPPELIPKTKANGRKRGK